AAIDDAFGSHPLEHHFHRREIVGDRVEMHLLEVVARRMFDLHRRVRAEEECLLLQLVGIVHPADGLADAAAAVRGHAGHAREILQNAAHDQTPQRQAQIEGPSDAGGETIVLHPFLAEARCGGWIITGTSRSCTSSQNGRASSSSGYWPLWLELMNRPLSLSSRIARSTSLR